MNPDIVASDALSYGTDPVVGTPTVTLAIATLVLGSFIVSGCARNQEATTPPPTDSVEQLHAGTKPAPTIVASFEGIGASFEGPQTPRNSSVTNQGTSTRNVDPANPDPDTFKLTFRNPSDNSLAVGPNHIIQTVNSRTAIFTKAGDQFDTSGDVLYGPVENSNFFHGFGGACEAINNGDTVVRFDQLAGRWLVVMPIFRRLPRRGNEPPVPTPDDGPVLSIPGNSNQPGAAAQLFIPDALSTAEAAESDAQQKSERERRRDGPAADGTFAMCYAVSASDDPMGAWYRYEFVRPLFPDYPRPAVWPDGWYVPTSTGDTIIEKHACVVERDRMLQGKPAREICVIVPDVSFLNNADLDGFQLPPPGSPNPIFATAGSQLNGVLGGDVIQSWNFYVDWTTANPGSPEWNSTGDTRLEGPYDIPVEPYAFLCGGQLTRCVPQPDTEERLDSQGDKLMARVVYRRMGKQESVVAAHSVAVGYDGEITVDPAPIYGDAGFLPSESGGVRWYEFRIGADDSGQATRQPKLYQQGTYAPGSASYRWLPSPAMDKRGNIGIGYSWATAGDFVGQRFAGRTPSDSLGRLSTAEAILATGQAPQTNSLRWEDYTQTAVDPADDCTIWYVGDFLATGEENYSSQIGAFRLPGCGD